MRKKAATVWILAFIRWVYFNVLVIFSQGPSFPETLNVCWTVLDFCSARSSLCSRYRCSWMASDTSELMSITSLGSPSSRMVSASDRSNFTSRARAILFRSRIHRLDKRLITSCFIMRGSLHAWVTQSFMASITASKESVRPWTITFWRQQHQESSSAGASGASSS